MATTTTIDINEMSETEIRNAVQQMQPRLATGKVKVALIYIRAHHPTCAQVLFDDMGRWRFMDADGEAFIFARDMDTDPLEDASYDIDELPVLYALAI
jgi:hypothetical protein